MKALALIAGYALLIHLLRAIDHIFDVSAGGQFLRSVLFGAAHLLYVLLCAYLSEPLRIAIRDNQRNRTQLMRRVVIRALAVAFTVSAVCLLVISYLDPRSLTMDNPYWGYLFRFVNSSRSIDEWSLMLSYFVPNVLLVVVIFSTVEELVFVGVLWNGLCSRGIGVIKAQFISIFSFVAIHLIGDPSRVVDVSYIISLCFARGCLDFLYRKTKSLDVPILLHCAWNALYAASHTLPYVLP